MPIDQEEEEKKVPDEKVEAPAPGPVMPPKEMPEDMPAKDPAPVVEPKAEEKPEVPPVVEKPEEKKEEDLEKKKDEDDKSFYGVEIFSAGTWNGDTYTTGDLDTMIAAFEKTSKTLKVPLKLGHDEDQKMLQKDGLPAAGWIGKLYRRGEKLMADLVDIPDKVFQLIRSGSYKQFSSEILWNANINNTNYKRMLSAVALLGADMPAVSNLDNALALHTWLNLELKRCYDFSKGTPEVKFYAQKREEITEDKVMKSVSEVKLEYELEAERKRILAFSEEAKGYKTILDEKENEIKALKEYRLKSESEASLAREKLEEAKLERDLTDLQAEKLISPSMKPYIKALLGEDRKEYSLKVGEKDEKLSKLDLVKSILKLYSEASAVNFEESSVDEKLPGEKTDEALDKKIKEYASKHNVHYSAAYKAVLKAAKA